MKANFISNLSPNTSIDLRGKSTRIYICVSCLFVFLSSVFYFSDVPSDLWRSAQDAFLKEDEILITFEVLSKKFNETSLATKYYELDLKLDFECLEKPGTSTPVILMSFGRSGSKAIWQMMSALTNSPKNIQLGREYTGGDMHTSLQFFDTTIPADEKLEKLGEMNNITRWKNEIPAKNHSKHGVWLQKYMCHLQRDHPDGIVGFKWKPFVDEFVAREEARESLQMIAALASLAADFDQKPPIRIVRSRRNAIDRQLSHLRHTLNSNLEPHCAHGDEECISTYKDRELQFIDDVPLFFKKLMRTWTEENLIDRILSEVKVPFISVSYEELFYPDEIHDGEEEWNRLIQYISPSSTKRLSWQDIHKDTTKFEATSSFRSHIEVIENWEDVYAAIKGTEIEHLFRM